MATIYPNGTDPLLFSETLPAGGTDTDNAPLQAQQSTSFTTVTSPSGGMTLSFVIFAYPNANNAAGAPTPPLIEIMTDGMSWQLLTQTIGQGSGSFNLGPAGSNQFVDYAYGPPDANGVATLTFLQNNAPFGGQTWDIRLTVNDGVTGTPTLPQSGLTFVIDSAGGLAPWVAVPGQQKNAPPPTLDFGAALANLTLAGVTPGAAKQLIAGKTYPLSVPVGNYGPGPLTVAAVSTVGAAQAVTLSLAAPITIAPGAVNAVALQASFQAPMGGQTASSTTLANFTLVSNDATAHFNTIAFNASAGNFEIVLALDMSGSMATNDAGGQTRWFQLQQATGQILNSILSFGGPSDTLGAVLYPARNGSSVGDVALPMGPTSTAAASALIATLSAAAPIDSTPMAGTATAAGAGGIYKAAGLPSNPATDCGLFSGSVASGFARNFRWMIVMSDGMSNVGDDPRFIAPSYFTSRKIGVISVGYGAPGGGQVDVDTLKAIANASTGQNAPNPPNYFGADPSSGLPSNQLLMGFEKAAANALGLSFAADPDGVLTSAAQVNQHKIMVGDYDHSGSFLVCAGTAPEGQLLFLELLTPLGERVNPSNAGNFSMTFFATALSRGYYASGKTLFGSEGRSRSGVWTMIVSAQRVAAIAEPAAVAAPTGLRYAYSATMDSALSLQVLSREPQHFAGETIHIVAALSLQGRPLANAQVVAAIVSTGAGFANWLAAQPVTDAEYQAALRSLAGAGLHDVQAIFVKTQALAAKGIFYPASGANVARPLKFDAHSGVFTGEFDATVQPGTYSLLVSAAGVDEAGAPFSRQQTWTTSVTPKPDGEATLVSIAYTFVDPNMTAILTVWPRDRFGNVFLVDPAVSQAIQILFDGGAKASGPLKWNLDGSYSLPFLYPSATALTISVQIGGFPVLSPFSPPKFTKMLFVDEALNFERGREAKPGANTFVDPGKALGDPSRKPASSFLALGGRGQATFAHKGNPVRAQSLTVFVHLDSALRRYVVQVLPAETGAGWVEIGRSEGVTTTFNLVPKPRKPIDDDDWFVEIEGRFAGGTFAEKVPLKGKLKFPIDPLTRIGGGGIVAVRILDLSNIVDNPDGSASASPGVGVLGVGFEAA